MALSNLGGYNAEDILRSIGGVKDAYNSIIDQIGNRMQTEFINEMADMWACEEAVNFFTNTVKTNIDRLILEVNATFNTVVMAMDHGGHVWADGTGNPSAYMGTRFEQNPKTSVDVSSIKTDFNGTRGIDMDNVQTVVNKLTDICEQAKNFATKVQDAVVNCGFIGGNQPQELSASLAVIKNSIDDAISSITQLVKTNINNTVSRYGAIQRQVSSSFQIEE